MIIYKITNRVNGKVYIGQTIRSLEHRWSQHCSNSSGCIYIHRAINKYGKENFTVEQIDVASDSEELNKKEQYWIAHYDSIAPKGYNMTTGGGNFERCDDSREKIRKRQTGEGNSFYGKTHSDEVKKRFSEQRKGEKNAMYGSARFGKKNPMYGKHHSEETKQRYREMFSGAKSAKAKKVICIETGEVFDTITIAANSVGKTNTHLCACCKGKVKTCGGFHWRYYDE